MSQHNYTWRRILHFPLYETRGQLDLVEVSKDNNGSSETVYYVTDNVEKETVTLATILLLSCVAVLLLFAVKTWFDISRRKSEEKVNLANKYKVKTFSQASVENISIIFWNYFLIFC